MLLLVSVFVLLCAQKSSGFGLSASLRTMGRKKTLKMVDEETLTVRGDEGLLDTARMEKAFKGTGIKVPEGEQLSIGVIGCGLAGMITAMELAEAGHKVRHSHTHVM
jgi:hypothetical protein